MSELPRFALFGQCGTPGLFELSNAGGVIRQGVHPLRRLLELFAARKAEWRNTSKNHRNINRHKTQRLISFPKKLLSKNLTIHGIQRQVRLVLPCLFVANSFVSGVPMQKILNKYIMPPDIKSIAAETKELLNITSNGF